MHKHVSWHVSFIHSNAVALAHINRHELKKMQGRYFSGRRVEASLWIGKQHFKRSNTADDVEDTGGAEGEKTRLDAFAHWLLTEGD